MLKWPLFSTLQACCPFDILSQFRKENVTLLTKDALTIKLGDIAKIVSNKGASTDKKGLIGGINLIDWHIINRTVSTQTFGSS